MDPTITETAYLASLCIISVWAYLNWLRCILGWLETSEEQEHDR